jgi:hypothetical protein
MLAYPTENMAQLLGFPANEMGSKSGVRLQLKTPHLSPKRAPLMARTFHSKPAELILFQGFDLPRMIDHNEVVASIDLDSGMPGR